MKMTYQQAIDAGIVFPASELCQDIGGEVVFTLPLELVSEMNRRDHWAVKHRRATRQKQSAYAHTIKHGHRLCARARGNAACFLVKLVRIMRRRQRPFDGDNLQSAFKAIRDGIADALGIDDGSDRLTWEYSQEKGDGKGMVRVALSEIEKGC